MIVLALYRHQSISEVVDELDLALLDIKASFVSKSAVSQARQRLGAEPLKALFDTSARAWKEQDRKQHLFNGLSLFVMDGLFAGPQGRASSDVCAGLQGRHPCRWTYRLDKL